jgi:predicted nucleotidyltransferase
VVAAGVTAAAVALVRSRRCTALVVRAALPSQCDVMEERDADPLLRAVANAAESLPEIQAAFLFGSQASGRVRADSDVDIAILIDGTSASVDARTRLRRVIEALAAHVAADRLDVVILNDAPPALAFQVLKGGKLAFERDRTALHRFRVRTYARHSDFESTERFFRAVTRRRALTGSSRG